MNPIVLLLILLIVLVMWAIIEIKCFKTILHPIKRKSSFKVFKTPNGYKTIKTYEEQ